MRQEARSLDRGHGARAEEHCAWNGSRDKGNEILLVKTRVISPLTVKVLTNY